MNGFLFLSVFICISDSYNTARQYKASSNYPQIKVIETWNVPTFITIDNLSIVIKVGTIKQGT